MQPSWSLPSVASWSWKWCLLTWPGKTLEACLHRHFVYWQQLAIELTAVVGRSFCSAVNYGSTQGTITGKLDTRDGGNLGSCLTQKNIHENNFSEQSWCKSDTSCHSPRKRIKEMKTLCLWGSSFKTSFMGEGKKNMDHLRNGAKLIKGLESVILPCLVQAKSHQKSVTSNFFSFMID